MRTEVLAILTSYFLNILSSGAGRLNDYSLHFAAMN